MINPDWKKVAAVVVPVLAASPAMADDCLVEATYTVQNNGIFRGSKPKTIESRSYSIQETVEDCAHYAVDTLLNSEPDSLAFEGTVSGRKVKFLFKGANGTKRLYSCDEPQKSGFTCNLISPEPFIPPELASLK